MHSWSDSRLMLICSKNSPLFMGAIFKVSYSGFKVSCCDFKVSYRDFKVSTCYQG